MQAMRIAAVTSAPTLILRPKRPPATTAAPWTSDAPDDHQPIALAASVWLNHHLDRLTPALATPAV